MTNSDATNMLLVSVLDFARGADLAAEVRRVRDLPLTVIHYAKGGYQGAMPSVESARNALQFLKGLSVCGCVSAGEALDSIFRDMRSGAFETWAQNVPVDVLIEYQTPNESLSIFIDRPHFQKGVLFSYGGAAELIAPVVRITRIKGSLITKIAKAMGQS